MAKIRTVCPVEPGKLQQLIEVFRHSDANGTQGQRSKKDPQKVAEFYCYIETLGGSVLEVFQKRFNACSHRVHANWIKQHDNIHPRDKFVFEGHKFDVLHVDNLDFQNVKTEIIVSEIVTRGNT